MLTFDESYYNNIWGTIHRHDYTESLANCLIQKYGKCRILDIGTGCGHLVKILREKGCDAWGLEISDYALENSCAHGYVLKGSVVDVPFKNDSFDVIHSQGLWEYVIEGDVDRAVQEIYRVGKFQEHNYDSDEQWNPEEHQKITIRSRKWWEEKLKGPKILVACPTHISKNYSFSAWIESINLLTYPNYEVFVVDNSPNGEMIEKYGKQIQMVQLENPSENWLKRINASMEVIRTKFLAGSYAYWLNLECDIIAPPNVIETLVRHAVIGDVCWTAHAYPFKGHEIQTHSGIGCSLLSRRLINDFSFLDAIGDSPDVWLWEEVKKAKKYPVLELWEFMKIKHLG